MAAELTGNITSMLQARDLSIAWGDTPQYWKWISLPESSFSEVAELQRVVWLNIKGNISSNQLAPKITYVAYLVFKLKEGHYGFDSPEQEGIIRVGETQLPTEHVSVLYDMKVAGNATHTPQTRVDNWMEVVLGEFNNDGGDGKNISIIFREIKGNQWKSGLIVAGIEVRPKNVASLMLPGRDLSIAWGNTPQYWKWISLPESRFSEVAELQRVVWLDIKGNIRSNVLAPKLTYVAYLVFKLQEGNYGFHRPEQEGIIKVGETQFPTENVSVLYDTKDAANATHTPQTRVDDWMEVVLGEFNNDGKNISITFREIKGNQWKSGLIVEGIEVRPKNVTSLMLRARQLNIAWGDTPQYWSWVSHPKSRFPDVAELQRVVWLGVGGKFSSKPLALNTNYVAYLVFLLKETHYGFDSPEQEAIIQVGENKLPTQYVSVLYDTSDAGNIDYGNATNTPKPRSDGWMEVVLGEFSINDRDEGNVSVRLRETKGNRWKSGLIVECIEVRRKN